MNVYLKILLGFFIFSIPGALYVLAVHGSNRTSRKEPEAILASLVFWIVVGILYFFVWMQRAKAEAQREKDAAYRRHVAEEEARGEIIRRREEATTAERNRNEAIDEAKKVL